ncbi:MAG TPA: condensation domain-containing protein [Thermoanaerobaculia bacterium]|nr:condensation domain-containing protein [Thermoanaerobaculia bacterium]
MRTAAQEQLWRLHAGLSAIPASEALDMFYALEVAGPLAAPALRGALEAMTRRHEPLAAGLAWEEVDLSHLPGEAAAAAAARRAAGESRHRFDLAGPLLRAALLRLAPERHVLLLNLHHMTADGWSLDLFARELSALYAHLREGREAERAALPSLREVVMEQRRWLESAEAGDQLEWWRGYLAGVSAASFRLPGDPARPAVAPAAVAPLVRMMRQVALLPPDLMAEAQVTAKRRGASLFMLLLTALQVVLARFTGTPEVVVGTLVANRPTPESAQVMGAHYNPLLLRADLPGDIPLGEALLRTVDGTLPALERQELPFPAVARALAETLGIPPRTIPAAVLQVDRYPLDALALAGATVTGLHLDPGGARGLAELGPRSLLAATDVPLTFFCREVRGRYTLSVFADPLRIAEPTAAALLASYQEVLLALTERLEEPIADLPLPIDEGPFETWAASEAPAEPAGPRLFPITDGSPVDALSPVTAAYAPEETCG